MKKWVKITLIIIAIILLLIIIYPKKVIYYEANFGGWGPMKVPMNYTEKFCNCIGISLYYPVYDAPGESYCLGIKNSCKCTNWYNKSSTETECEQ
ncbi:hypothetical protein COU54_01130 [Candidatus Pacearchaeota archaeon CG10_big_fil_rev_8_21_14_0_10_31_24]|nr:MAG: hypothetical protein COU54_01130 [Candidatus Pacearchaeota archaeon CG10_big_fil_rev_8_21_14_0_10_31_24]